MQNAMSPHITQKCFIFKGFIMLVTEISIHKIFVVQVACHIPLQLMVVKYGELYTLKFLLILQLLTISASS